MLRMFSYSLTIQVVAITCSAPLTAVADTFSPLSFAYNCNLDDCNVKTGGVPIGAPKGAVVFGGVPFSIPTNGLDSWVSHAATGANPRRIEIPVNLGGVNRAYTLINTHWGKPGGPYAWIEFWGENGAYFRKNLVGNVDIRDWLYSRYTNSINGTSTMNVFKKNPGAFLSEKRLDMQIIDLPPVFLTRIMTKIRLSDSGGDGVQRVFLGGLTLRTQDSSGSIVPTITLRSTSGSLNLLAFGATNFHVSGSGFASDPATDQNAGGDTVAAVRDASNSLFANVFRSGPKTWGSWTFLIGGSKGVPAVAVAPNGVAWVAYRMVSNEYSLVSYNTANTTVGPPVNLLGAFSTDPEVAACPDGSIYVLGSDNSQSLKSNRYVPGTGTAAGAPVVRRSRASRRRRAEPTMWSTLLFSTTPMRCA